MRHSDEQEIYHLTPPLFIAMPLAGLESERSCICVIWVYIYFESSDEYDRY